MIYAFVPRNEKTDDKHPDIFTEDKNVTEQKNMHELNQVERERIFRKICDNMFDTYHRKNMDYGNAFGESFKEFGMTAAVIRIGDKYRRIRSLANKDALVKEESIKDTLLDLANYAIMTLIEMEND